MHKLSHHYVTSFFLCRDCPNAPFTPAAMKIGRTLHCDHGTALVQSCDEQLASEKTLFFNSLSSLSRGYTWLQASNISPCLNKWKFIYDYWGKAAWIVGALEFIRIKIFYLISLRYWQRNKVCALKCLLQIFFNNQASCLLHVLVLRHNLRREYVSYKFPK